VAHGAIGALAHNREHYKPLGHIVSALWSRMLEVGKLASAPPKDVPCAIWMGNAHYTRTQAPAADLTAVLQHFCSPAQAVRTLPLVSPRRRTGQAAAAAARSSSSRWRWRPAHARVVAEAAARLRHSITALGSASPMQRSLRSHAIARRQRSPCAT
jgi:hypothetical protein